MLARRGQAFHSAVSVSGLPEAASDSMELLMNNARSLIYAWTQRVLFIGPSFHHRRREYVSAALMVGLDNPLQLTEHNSGCCLTTPVALFPPGARISAGSGGGLIAVLFLDCFQFDYLHLRKRAAHDINGLCYGFHETAEWQALFRAAYKNKPAIGEISQQLPFVAAHQARSELVTKGVDPRIIEAMSLLQQTIAGNSSTETVARNLNLSVSRVGQLFKQHLGAPVGRYRQWLRLHHCMLAMTRGISLTEAATNAGFADQAHFCNTFKTILGSRPSLFLGDRSGALIVTGNNEQPSHLEKSPPPFQDTSAGNRKSTPAQESLSVHPAHDDFHQAAWDQPDRPD